MSGKIIMYLSFLWLASLPLHAVEVQFHCGTAIVTGEPSEVTEFGLEYLRRLNPRIMETRSGREAVAAVCRCGASGRLNLVAEPKPWKDAMIHRPAAVVHRDQVTKQPAYAPLRRAPPLRRWGTEEFMRLRKVK